MAFESKTVDGHQEVYVDEPPLHAARSKSWVTNPLSWQVPSRQ